MHKLMLNSGAAHGTGYDVVRKLMVVEINKDDVFRDRHFIESDFTVDRYLDENRLGGTTEEGDYITIPKGTLLQRYRKIESVGEPVKESNKTIWEQKEDDISDINGEEAFDVLKRMLGGS